MLNKLRQGNKYIFVNDTMIFFLTAMSLMHNQSISRNVLSVMWTLYSVINLTDAFLVLVETEQ